METASTNNPPEPKHAWLVSLAFWLTLLCATLLYASVALSPKYLVYLTLKNDYHANQVRLVTLEKQVGHLHKVVDALENDTHFAAELARVDFDAFRPGDERIAVGPHLTLDARPAQAASSVPATTLPWYGPVIRLFAQNHHLRSMTLAASALLVIVSFTFMHESQTPQLRSATTSAGSVLRAFANRYRKRRDEID